MTKSDLLITAIELDPKDPFNYRDLAEILPEGGFVTHSDGRSMTKEDLEKKYKELSG